MAYGNNYGNRGGYGNGGGYQQNNYGNNGGYQKQPPQPVDINAEINARIDLYLQIQEQIKARGLDPTEFAFAIGGWTTSLLLQIQKGK